LYPTGIYIFNCIKNMSGSKCPYLDGIEFRLSDVFKERPVSRGPKINSRDINRILDVCNYDFSIEHKVMADYAERKRLEKEAYHQNEKQRLKNSVRKESNASSKTYDGNPRPSSSNGQLNEKQPTHSFIGDDSILTPSPASKDNSFDQQKEVIQEIDLNDFEVKNQDPFSQAELNTIDEMKELSDVLRIVTMAPNSNVVSTPIISSTPNITTSTTPAPSTNQKSVVIDALTEMITNEIQADLICINQKDTSALPKVSAHHSPHSSSRSSPVASPRLYERKPLPTPKPRKSMEVEESPVQQQVLKNKSLEDRQRFEATINKAMTSLPQLPKRPPAPTTHSPTTEDDLTNGLSPEEQHFILSICGMGFNKKHVLQVMQRYGQNHKEVVDRLCVYQRMKDRGGYSFQEVDDSLEVFNGDEKQVFMAIFFLLVVRVYLCYKLQKNSNYNKITLCHRLASL